MRAADTFEDAPCLKNPALWESTEQWDHEEAAVICNTVCPALKACGEWLLETQARVGPSMVLAGGGASGTWAGILVGADEPRWPTCGTDGGYFSHRRNGEVPCVDCWEAHCKADADRYSRRQLARNTPTAKENAS